MQFVEPPMGPQVSKVWIIFNRGVRLVHPPKFNITKLPFGKATLQGRPGSLQEGYSEWSLKKLHTFAVFFLVKSSHENFVTPHARTTKNSTHANSSIQNIVHLRLESACLYIKYLSLYGHMWNPIKQVGDFPCHQGNRISEPETMK